jgi:hypothetical protein
MDSCGSRVNAHLGPVGGENMKTVSEVLICMLVMYPLLVAASDNYETGKRFKIAFFSQNVHSFVNHRPRRRKKKKKP